ncbi:protein phosphatase 1G [Selaginella moellendorffii]|nr:protein phosphatase 1G [Selaginella moellendorffii]|eukprot:XP_002960079.2 protein phosphatase 1G [Selaginella moellendorffii]
MEVVEDRRVRVLCFQDEGFRSTMEDAHSVAACAGGNASLIGVYDGHGGDQVARFCAGSMSTILGCNQAFRDGDYARSLHQVFMEADSRAPDADDCGSTATVALVTDDNQVFLGNVGDSFCCLFVDGYVMDISQEHDCKCPGELDRVVKAGGYVERGSKGRITLAGKEDDVDSLMVTRSIGDWSFKSNPQLSREEQAVSAVPDIVNFDISKGCHFLILASDGVDKNSIDDYHCGQIRKALQARDYEQLKQVVYKILSSSKNDNQTLLLVELKAAAKQQVHSSPSFTTSSWYTNPTLYQGATMVTNVPASKP